ncbi:hypothetical protein [Lactococcus lactis]|uniref:Uncharacterized protein n=1 Tax=Lactococcus lactis subsp. lactis TaxID=1360 RepID=A0A0V8E1A2_LACLL|nr:hypothetical protein [Lactococcus lactis]KSU19429.1 hypothetical protein M20_2048 [Lactococcus lactis subsp. lactis]MCC4121736.1 hypothetical protein [Lactococcus lactis]
MKFIQSETLNKQLLNVLILLKDALYILLKYYLLCTIGAIILSITNSKTQVLKVVNVYEALLGTLFLLAVIVVPPFLIMSRFGSFTSLLSSLNNAFHQFINKRRMIILYGILPLTHAYSVGMKSLNHFSFDTVMTHLSQMFLTLLLMDFFIAAVKERYLGTLFFATPSNSTLSVEGTFTPYGRKSISSLTESGTKNLENSFSQGQVNLNITALLTPISRKFVKTPDGLYHFVNSRYVIVLFTLHKIRLFFKGMIKAIKYKSLDALSSVVEHEGKVMTSKQRLIYELILLVLVTLSFNAIYVWLGR